MTAPQVAAMVPHPADTLTALQDVLAAATRLAHDLSRDRLLPRLLEVFQRMPAEDRDTIVRVLEREVDLRTLTKETPTAALSGVRVTKPNPNARLYMRLTENEPAPYVSPEEIMQAVLRAAGVVQRAAERGHDVKVLWGSAIVEGLRRTTAHQRGTLRAYHRMMLDLVEEAEGPAR